MPFHLASPDMPANKRPARKGAKHESQLGIRHFCLGFFEENHTELPALATVSSFVTLLQGSNAHCEGLNWALQLCKSWRMRGFCCSNFWIAQDIKIIKIQRLIVIVHISYVLKALKSPSNQGVAAYFWILSTCHTCDVNVYPSDFGLLKAYWLAWGITWAMSQGPWQRPVAQTIPNDVQGLTQESCCSQTERFFVHLETAHAWISVLYRCAQRNNTGPKFSAKLILDE